MSVFRCILMAFIVIAISACGAFPEPDHSTEAESGVEPVDTATGCEWSRARGIAELMEIRNGVGLFHFHPNSIPVTQGVDPDWAVGDEFKAILETPAESGCAPRRLLELKPLAPTD